MLPESVRKKVLSQGNAFDKLTLRHQRLIQKALFDHRERLAQIFVAAASGPKLTPAVLPNLVPQIAGEYAFFKAILTLMAQQLEQDHANLALEHVEDLVGEENWLAGTREQAERDTAEVLLLALAAVALLQALAREEAEVKRAAYAAALAQTAPETAARQAKTVAKKVDHHVRTVISTEATRAYNESTDNAVAAIVAVTTAAGLAGQTVWLKRIVEVIDHRNHPFSRAAHGNVAKPKGEFRVSKKEARRARAALKKGKARRVAGVFWRSRGDFWYGKTLPAHYNDRGRIVPWKLEWGIPEDDRKRLHLPKPRAI